MTHDAPVQNLALQTVSGFWAALAIGAAARLRLADHAARGPVGLAELARRAGADAGALGRLMNGLCAAGLFRRDADGRFRAAPAADVLRSDHPQSQRGLLDVLTGGEHFAAWGELEAALRTGRTAFDLRHGMGWLDYYAAHPAAGLAFAEAMSGATRAFEDALLAADAFPPFRLAVDVGGGHGAFLRRLVTPVPGAAGLVLDLPEVIAGWPADAGDRVTGVAGDFFGAVPAGGDLYVLKSVLHDWEDNCAAAILASVRAGIPSGGRLAVVETVLPDEPAPHPGWLMDLNMLVMTGGRERSLSEFERLLAGAGFSIETVAATDSPFSVIVAAPRA